MAQQSQTGLHPGANVIPHGLVQQIASLPVRLGLVRPVVRLGNSLGQIHFLKLQEQALAEGLQIQPLSPPRVHYRTDIIWKTIIKNRINKKIGIVKSSDLLLLPIEILVAKNEKSGTFRLTLVPLIKHRLY
ncbi:MAG: hypothetical protein LOD87_13805, partial [Planifilum fulgidum]